MSKHVNTHGQKAESYNIGRPDYPKEFYSFLYEELGFKNAIIADIGAGTGKVTKGFLAKGSTVYAIEPDADMIKVLCNNLAGFPGCIPIISTAENTGIPDGKIDIIFCGNSYHWFDKSAAIPEFKRILRDTNRKYNIVISSLGPGCAKTESPFEDGMFVEKTFEYTVCNGFHEFLHGHLSASNAPTADEDCFEEYCESIKQTFEKECINGQVETKFTLHVIIGNVNNLKLCQAF